MIQSTRAISNQKNYQTTKSNDSYSMSKRMIKKREEQNEQHLNKIKSIYFEDSLNLSREMIN